MTSSFFLAERVLLMETEGNETEAKEKIDDALVLVEAIDDASEISGEDLPELVSDAIDGLLGRMEDSEIQS